MHRPPCMTSPTITVSGRIRARKAASPTAARDRTNTGRRSDALTTSMATAIWYAPVRRSAITRRRRSENGTTEHAMSRTDKRWKDFESVEDEDHKYVDIFNRPDR